MRVVALAGGIGGARFLEGLVRVVDPLDLTVVANTGDDLVLHGLHISPDLDTITYTLGGGIHPEQRWGRAEETFAVADELRARYGQTPWFTLGDRDLATHLVRTGILAGGGTLTQATAAIAAAWGLPFRLLPMSDDPLTTMIATADGRERDFQRWWVGEHAADPAVRVWLAGVEDARPAPGVLEAIAGADVVVLCPSNPVVSIGTILQVPGIRDAVRARPVVGVTPIVGGAPVRGMADRLMPAMGVPVTTVGAASLHADVLDAWVVDEVDRDLADRVEVGRVVVTDTIMRTPKVAADLARTALDALA